VARGAYGGKAAKRIKPALLKNYTLQIALFQTLLKNFRLSKSSLFSKLKPSIHRHLRGIAPLTLNKINYLITTRPLTCGCSVRDVLQQRISKEEKQIPNLISFLYIMPARGIEISRCIPKDSRPRGLFPGMLYLPMSSL
jgi:hypothetical protein